jgi:tetratricopeptide (TPR) repeat protein
LLVAAAPIAADDDFIAAALVASGTDDACEVAHWQSVYAELRGRIVGDELRKLPHGQRLTAIHGALHSQILIGAYRPAASDLRVALARGDYNCLSAAALEFDLCRAAGIELEIWSRPGHVWLQTRAGAKVEPASVSGVASQPITPAVRKITPRQLLGKFYYNRGVQTLARGDYAAGLALVRTALRLDPQDRDARENLLAGINNWAAQHLRARQYDQAARLIRQGLAIEPAYGPLVANQRLLP